jgi:D-tyrosyl-tRNA(Tyr) deacylase
MRAVVQRVQRASVDVDGATVSSIGPGLLVLVGIHAEDTLEDAKWLAGKVLKVRCFENAEGKPWADDVCATTSPRQVLFVSQFTLHGSFAGGNKPDLHNAMPPGPAKALYDRFLEHATSAWPGGGEGKIHDGVFGASMAVSLVNDGPVTFVLDSKDRKA